ARARGADGRRRGAGGAPGPGRPRRHADRRAGGGRAGRAAEARRPRDPRARGATGGRRSPMNRALLEKPFEPAQIRQRKGRNGVLDYVEGHNVIHRLNESLDGPWSFEMTHPEIREDEVLVLGRLSADGITKMQFGVSQVTREKGSGALVSLGDDLKAAATDALKKCATFLGV